MDRRTPEGQMNGTHDEYNTRFSQFYERALKTVMPHCRLSYICILDIHRFLKIVFMSFFIENIALIKLIESANNQQYYTIQHSF